MLLSGEHYKIQNQATDTYLTTAKEILELARDAKELWLKRNQHERVEFLKKLLWNPKITGTTIEYHLKKPFEIIHKMRGNEKWGGYPPTSRTKLPPVEVSEMLDFKVMPKYLDRDFLQQKYVVERLSTIEIAKLIASSRGTVLKYLKAHGIPVRGTGSNIRRWNQAYGIKVQKRRETIVKREIDTIAKMRSLRAEGFSYWKIASILNSMKVATRSGRATWQARTVQRIIERVGSSSTHSMG